MKKRGRKTKKKRSSKNRSVASNRPQAPSAEKSKQSLTGNKTAVVATAGISKTPNGKKVSKGVAGSKHSVVHKFSQFFRESKKELTRVKWPTRKELFASTAVVIILSLISAFFLGLVDFGLIKMIKGIVG